MPDSHWSREALQAIAAHIAREKGIPMAPFMGQIHLESRWNPNARRVNRNGSVDLGISQFNDGKHNDGGTAKEFGLIDEDGTDHRVDPVASMEAQADLLLKRGGNRGDWQRAFGAYNPGDKAYVQKVLDAAKHYGTEGLAELGVRKAAPPAAQAAPAGPQMLTDSPLLPYSRTPPELEAPAPQPEGKLGPESADAPPQVAGKLGEPGEPSDPELGSIVGRSDRGYPMVHMPDGPTEVHPDGLSDEQGQQFSAMCNGGVRMAEGGETQPKWGLDIGDNGDFEARGANGRVVSAQETTLPDVPPDPGDIYPGSMDLSREQPLVRGPNGEVLAGQEPTPHWSADFSGETPAFTGPNGEVRHPEPLDRDPKPQPKWGLDIGDNGDFTARDAEGKIIDQQEITFPDVLPDPGDISPGSLYIGDNGDSIARDAGGKIIDQQDTEFPQPKWGLDLRDNGDFTARDASGKIIDQQETTPLDRDPVPAEGDARLAEQGAPKPAEGPFPGNPGTFGDMLNQLWSRPSAVTAGRGTIRPGLPTTMSALNAENGVGPTITGAPALAGAAPPPAPPSSGAPPLPTSGAPVVENDLPVPPDFEPYAPSPEAATNQDLAAATAQQQAGINADVDVQKQLGTERESIAKQGADAYNKLLAAQQTSAAQARQSSMAKMQDYENAVRQVASMRVDPSHWWSSRSTGQQALGYLGVLVSGLSGADHNMAMDGIQKNIDRDIDAQKDNIANAQHAASGFRNLYEMNLGIFKNEDAARLATAAMLKDQLAQQGAAIEGHLLGPAAAATGQMKSGLLQQSAVMDRMKAHALLYNNELERNNAAISTMNYGTQALAHTALETLSRSPDSEGGGGPAALSPQQKAALFQVTPADQRIQTSEGTVLVRNPLTQKQKEQLPHVAVAKQALTRLQTVAAMGLRGKVDPRLRGQVHADMLGFQSGYGAATGTDFLLSSRTQEMWDKAMNNPTSLSPSEWSEVKKNLDTFAQQLQGAESAIVSSAIPIATIR